MQRLIEILTDPKYEDRPENLSQLPAFEEKCKEQGHAELAAHLEEWRIHLETQIENEFWVGEEDICEICNHKYKSTFHYYVCEEKSYGVF